MTTAPSDPPDKAPRCLTNTLDHLPEAKRYQLERIKEVLCSTVSLDWLVLFGSYARGDWVEDPIHRYFSDYDLLVVVSEPFLVQRAGLWERLERELQAIAGRVPVTLLVHTHKEVNHEIRIGQYFFCDIMNEGVVLYDGHRSQFAHVKAQAPEERLALPEDGEAPELPPLPEVEDRAAMERWGRLVAAEQRERGLAEGLKRETARARKIAGTLLAKGMAAEEVAEITGLSVNEVEALPDRP